MDCLICNSKLEYFFSKDYSQTRYQQFTKDIGQIKYYKCISCGLTISKTHCELDIKRWEKLNSDFHHYHENHVTSVNQPPYLEQALMIKILSENGIISSNDMLDYAGGYGSLSKILKKNYKINLPVYDPYIKNEKFVGYVEKKDLTTYKTVLNSALFEHLFTRGSFDAINSLVSKDDGVMIIHTVVCENVPKNSDWFYLEPPVHTTFHTNKSMNILMKQWGYTASIYCLAAKSWILLRKPIPDIEIKILNINKDFQTEYLIYKEGFVDYWKGFK